MKKDHPSTQDSLMALREELATLKLENQSTFSYGEQFILMEAMEPQIDRFNRVWKGRYGDEQPVYIPKEKKPDGSFIGTIYEKMPTKPQRQNESGKRWLGKIGTPDEAKASTSYKTISRLRKTADRDAYKEFLAGSLYQALSYLCGGAFQVPKIRLAWLPIKNSFTEDNLDLKMILMAMNEGRSKNEKVTHSVHVMSRWSEDYRDLCSAEVYQKGTKNLISYWDVIKQTGEIPDRIVVEGHSIPLHGLPALLASARLLGDVDVLGGGGKNAGFVVVRENGLPAAAYVVKVDPGYSFFVTSESRLFNTLYPPTNPSEQQTCKKLNDKRDIQIGSNTSIDSVVCWKTLTEVQKNQFLDALQSGMILLSCEPMLTYFLERGGKINAGTHNALVTDTVNQHYRASIKQLLEVQEQCYGELLRAKKPTRSLNFFLRVPIKRSPLEKISAMAGIVKTLVTSSDIEKILKAATDSHLANMALVLSQQPKLAWAIGTVIDRSGRQFNDITAFQYAVWAGDWEMWELILRYLPEKEAAIQYEAFREFDRYSEHGKKYDYSLLLHAYQQHIKLCNEREKNEDFLGYGNRVRDNSEKYAHHWKKVVGQAQRTLPAAGIWRMCQIDYSTDRQYEKEHLKWWFEESYEGKLGEDWAAIVGGRERQRLRIAMPSTDLRNFQNVVSTDELGGGDRIIYYRPTGDKKNPFIPPQFTLLDADLEKLKKFIEYGAAKRSDLERRMTKAYQDTKEAESKLLESRPHLQNSRVEEKEKAKSSNTVSSDQFFQKAPAPMAVPSKNFTPQ